MYGRNQHNFVIILQLKTNKLKIVFWEYVIVTCGKIICIKSCLYLYKEESQPGLLERTKYYFEIIAFY